MRRTTQTASRTYAELQRDIEALQAEAETVRKQEVEYVVAQIREAIAAYGLTQDQLFGVQAVGRKSKSQRTTAATKKPDGKQKAVGLKSKEPKYRDPATGNTWTGNGKRPRWFVAAIEAGADPQSLSIGVSAPAAV